jgi:hypothetical protein
MSRIHVAPGIFLSRRHPDSDEQANPTIALKSGSGRYARSVNWAVRVAPVRYVNRRQELATSGGGFVFSVMLGALT